MFDNIKKNFIEENHDALYEYVMEEMEKEELHKGLWAKALALSEGNNDKAKSLYMQYRVQAIKDECKSSGLSLKKLSKEQLFNAIKNGFKSDKEPSKTDEKPQKAKEEKKSYTKLGGWLIFFAIILVIGNLNILMESLKVLTSEHYETLELLLSKNQAFMVSQINIQAYLLFFGLFFNIALTSLFFTKSNTTRKFAIIYFVVSIVNSIIMVAMFMNEMNHLPKELFNAMYSSQDTIKEFVRPIGISLISLLWILYFIFSKRVKATFTNQKPIMLMIALSSIVPLAMSIYHYTQMNKIETPLVSLTETVEVKKEQKLSGVQIDNKWGFIDTKGNWIVQPIYDEVKNFNDDLASVKINGKWGFIDRKGNIAIEPTFEVADYFNEGLASIKIDGKYGSIDKKGHLVIQPIFRAGLHFQNGFALINEHYKIKDATTGTEEYVLKWGFIDKKGTVIVSPSLAGLSYFNEDLASVKINEKWGFINTKGEIVIQSLFDKEAHFYEGLASVELNGKHGFIDKKGNWAIQPIFESASKFNEGLARVEMNDKYGFIDKKGNWVIQPLFKFVDSSFYEGLARFKLNDKVGFIDKQGNIVIQATFLGVERFENGLAPFRLEKDSKIGFIDKQGNVVIQPLYTNAYSFQ